jgi:hypothetical protein
VTEKRDKGRVTEKRDKGRVTEKRDKGRMTLLDSGQGDKNLSPK